MRKRLEGEPDPLRLGPEAILYAIMDRVGRLRPRGGGPGERHRRDGGSRLRQRGRTEAHLRLSREVIQFQRATQPLPGILEDVIGGIENPELQRYLRDVQDHAPRVTEQVASFRELLQNIPA